LRPPKSRAWVASARGIRKTETTVRVGGREREATGLTHGTVTDVATIVGPVAYDPGECWFVRSIVVEGVDGTLFSDRGDSGSAVLKENGEVIGLLYAGNGEQTYICPIDEVLRALNCTLA
jgi:hypothetical protein